MANANDDRVAVGQTRHGREGDKRSVVKIIAYDPARGWEVYDGEKRTWLRENEITIFWPTVASEDASPPEAPSAPPATSVPPPVVPLAVGQKRKRSPIEPGYIEIVEHETAQEPEMWAMRYTKRSGDTIHSRASATWIMTTFPFVVPPPQRPEDISEAAWELMPERLRERAAWAFAGLSEAIGTLCNISLIREYTVRSAMEQATTELHARMSDVLEPSFLGEAFEAQSHLFVGTVANEEVDRQRKDEEAALRAYEKECETIMYRVELLLAEKRRQDDLAAAKKQRDEDLAAAKKQRDEDLRIAQENMQAAKDSAQAAKDALGIARENTKAAEDSAQAAKGSLRIAKIGVVISIFVGVLGAWATIRASSPTNGAAAAAAVAPTAAVIVPIAAVATSASASAALSVPVRDPASPAATTAPVATISNSAKAP